MFRVLSKTLNMSFCLHFFPQIRQTKRTFRAHTTTTNTHKMIPSRTSHSSSIGPGVVPRGADPAYDEEVKREYDLRKNIPHLGKGSKGRPFSIDPSVGVMTRTQYVLFFLFFSSLDDLLLFFDATLVKAVRLAVCYTLCARGEKGERDFSRSLLTSVRSKDE